MSTGEMKRWWPLALLGLGSLGVLLFSERKAVGPFGESLDGEGDNVSDFEDTVEHELDRIQATLKQVTRSLTR